MRDIKFRAWDEENNQMIQWDDTFFYDTSAVTNWSGDFSYIKMPLMQFTGLLDSNGREIYEGDILEGTTFLYGYQLQNGEQFNYKGYVEWGNQCDVGLCWLLSDKNGSWELKQTVHRNNIDYSTGIIIGNIYENPELLSK